MSKSKKIIHLENKITEFSKAVGRLNTANNRVSDLKHQTESLFRELFDMETHWVADLKWAESDKDLFVEIEIGSLEGFKKTHDQLMKLAIQIKNLTAINIRLGYKRAVFYHTKKGRSVE